MVADHQIKVQTNRQSNSKKTVTFTEMPSIVHYFIVVEEIGKDGFLVRKVYASPIDPYLLAKKLTAQEVNMQVNPEKFGMSSVSPNSNASVAEHVYSSRKYPSSYISTSSNFPEGSPRFSGKTVFIDIAEAQKHGTKLVTTDEIFKSLQEYKQKNPHLSSKISEIQNWVKHVDNEILLQAKNKIPAKAIYTPESLSSVSKFTKAARVLQVTAIAFTAYDLSVAANKSYKTKSMVPITREVVKQAGGWGGAWVGFKIGAATGAFFGIETGPGAIITGAVGGIIFGLGGYWGAEWVLGPDRSYNGASGSW
jgi:hypothetical protein